VLLAVFGSGGDETALWTAAAECAPRAPLASAGDPPALPGWQ
jgi:hypothetical protein